MSQRCIPFRVKAGLGLLLIAVASNVIACDEDSKTAPERCADPALPIFDIQTAGVPTDDNAQYPCSTKIGHSVSSIGSPSSSGTTSSAGTTSSSGKNGGGSAGKNGGGSAGKNTGGSAGVNVAGTGGI